MWVKNLRSSIKLCVHARWRKDSKAIMRTPLKSMLSQEALNLVLALHGSLTIAIAASKGEANGAAPLHHGESGLQIVQYLLAAASTSV